MRVHSAPAQWSHWRLTSTACRMRILWRRQTMKERLWLQLITCLGYFIDKELCKENGYSREQVRGLVAPQV